jgi:hypothetical protein
VNCLHLVFIIVIAYSITISYVFYSLISQVKQTVMENLRQADKMFSRAVDSYLPALCRSNVTTERLIILQRLVDNNGNVTSDEVSLLISKNYGYLDLSDACFSYILVYQECLILRCPENVTNYAKAMSEKCYKIKNSFYKWDTKDLNTSCGVLKP